MTDLKKKIIIAIDGYSSCGKSSFAKLIARELGYIYLDSGAMYRAVALYALQNNMDHDQQTDIPRLLEKLPGLHIDFKNIDGENITFLNGTNVERDIRGFEVSSVVSVISKIPEVRSHLVKLQQQLGAKKGIVMDGRDIGTVVFPGAEIKIFMTAGREVRARRRYNELQSKGIEADLREVAANIDERDYQDINRNISPLIQAPDAIVLDNSNMSFDQQMNWFHSILKEKGLIAGK